MKNHGRILPLCLTVMFGLGIGTAQAQATPAQKAAGTYGTGSLAKHKEHSHETARRKMTKHSRKRMASGKLKGEEFKSEAAAKAHCPTQTVVWVNTHGHVFHLPRSKYYGKTKYGAFACEKAAETAGFKASKY